MKVLTTIETMQWLAKTLQKPCMYLSFPPYSTEYDFVKESLACAPYLDIESCSQVLGDGHAVIVFDTYDEMQNAYEQTKGDDPNNINKYVGPTVVYALTCNAKGELENENT